MKKFFIFSALLLFCFVSSQYRFKYLLNFKIDSTNRTYVQQEVFNLDVMNGKSIFYSEAFAKLDSIRNVGSSLYRENIPEPKLDYIVSFNSKQNQVDFKEVLGFAVLEVKDPRKIQWFITTRTDVINNYKVQKAYAEFGGRYWTAWFTTDIPVTDGPYKFKGLPGLLVKICDSNEDYVFELIQVQKLDKLLTDFKSFEKLGLKTIEVDFEKYKQLKEKFIKNPETFLFNMPESSNLPSDEIKIIVESLKSRQQKNNNEIELSFKEEKEK